MFWENILRMTVVFLYVLGRDNFYYSGVKLCPEIVEKEYFDRVGWKIKYFLFVF